MKAPLSTIALTLVITGVAVALAATDQEPRPAPARFFSSFEPADPQPAWTDAVDTDEAGRKKASGIEGPADTGALAAIPGEGLVLTASDEYTDAGEVKENLFDGDPSTKWLAQANTGWVQARLPAPIALTGYALVSANDAPERDPGEWSLKASSDGTRFVTLDRQRGQRFEKRFERKEYRLENAAPYLYYRLEVTRNQGDDFTQDLAELQLLRPGESRAAPPPEMTTRIEAGPAISRTAKVRVGFTGQKALRYEGQHKADGRAYSYNKVFEVEIPVTAATELSYLVFPTLSPGDLGYRSTYTAVDLAFGDGTYLSALGALDQHSARLDPQAQGRSKTLYVNQWNYKKSAIGKVAEGKTIRRVLVAYDNPDGPGPFQAWFDDIRIAEAPPRPRETRLSDHVLITRGTHSSGGFSRGNNIPAVAVPNGFNFWVPMTNAGSTSWLYDYHRTNNAQNLPTLQAFTASHEPSPWMGDRQVFQMMPSAAAGTPDADRVRRALPFRHDDEVARPYYYAVTFQNGVKTEVTPTDHAALFRFTFPGAEAALIFDSVSDNGGLALDPEKREATGHSDVRSGLSAGATRMFVYAVFDKPVRASGMLPGGGGPNVTGYFRFDAGADRVVTMRIATSMMSVAQAKRNLELEIAPADAFDSVKERAQRLWDDRLHVVEVEGATDDQMTSLYSNLYRLFLYPNAGHENTGTREKPVYRYASPFSVIADNRRGRALADPAVKDGRIYVNNGFWDTFRTAWPALTLLAPRLAGELIDGFVQQYKDGGWVARWSSPGYADLMAGTSSDVAFADAFVKGVTGFDAPAAYEAALKNASVVPPSSNVGRKGLETSLFLGYTSTDTDEGTSWALDGYVNDFGIANMAQALAASPRASVAERRRYLEEHEYYLDRALNYVHMFDPGIGFFQGRAADGAWRLPRDQYDPRVWGNDYTETNGWNFAFTVPHDGRGLANLYGGKEKLAAKLDAYFATPETGEPAFAGSYGGVIHEMTEARDTRMGQYGHSNQPCHHVIYMYNYAGQPWKTQEKVREVLRRLYLGSEIGQGYLGDEDNGEMSAWYVLSALGLYPLQVGSAYYAVGSPLFARATVNLENGKKLVINARNNGPDHPYVQELRLNGKPYDKTYLPHEFLAGGAVLDFDMGAGPSAWGTGKDAAPLSITQGAAVPAPMRDVTGPGKGSATAGGDADPAALFDNTSKTRAAFPGPAPWVQYALAAAEPVVFYTLTSGDVPGDPRTWTLKGSSDGRTWTVLDERTDERFPWRLYTRPFKVARPGRYAQYRLEVTANTGEPTTSLAEVELLARPLLARPSRPASR